MTSILLSVVVPVYQEVRGVERATAALREHLKARGEPWELVLVDDGSRDGTAGVVALLAQGDPDHVRVETHRMNRGKGAAVRTGLAAARGERVVYLDADLSTDLAALGPLCDALDAGADLVVGSRRAAGAELVHRQPRLREFAGRVFSRLARAVVDPHISDFTCGFKGLRAGAARRLAEELTVSGWAFDAEVLALARRHAWEVVEIPVRWSHRDGSRVRVLRAGFEALGVLLRLARQRVRPVKPARENEEAFTQ